jgi:hypothetical protein
VETLVCFSHKFWKRLPCALAKGYLWLSCPRVARALSISLSHPRSTNTMPPKRSKTSPPWCKIPARHSGSLAARLPKGKVKCNCLFSPSSGYRAVGEWVEASYNEAGCTRDWVCMIAKHHDGTSDCGCSVTTRKELGQCSAHHYDVVAAPSEEHAEGWCIERATIKAHTLKRIKSKHPPLPCMPAAKRLRAGQSPPTTPSLENCSVFCQGSACL